MNYDNIIMDFPVTVYGNLEKYNDVISKGRCRIFYKGANRNGTFITDEFADRLLSTIPYAPVKGIFNAEEDDFTDHGIVRDEGRIYGIVPAEPNLAWESQIDEDGVERTYACVDVLLYTSIYKEASMILGKAQSMELYGKNIKGDWQIIDGKRYYVFSDACFLGLQALGDDVEPCFEGAAFYTVYNALEKFMDAVEEYQKNYTQSGQGGNTMPSVTFKVSDSQKLEFLWNILNPGFNEENGFALDYAICDVYDEYAIAFNYNERIYERVYYVKDDETDSLSVKKKERCYIIDVNENEKNALEALHKLNGDTYEKVDESFAEIAKKRNMTRIQVALGWLLSKVESPVIGATKISHIEEAIKDMKESFINVKELNVDKTNPFWRSLLKKQGIISDNSQFNFKKNYNSILYYNIKARLKQLFYASIELFMN